MRPELRGPQAPPAPGGSCAPAGVPRGPRLWAVATAMRLPRARPSLGPPASPGTSVYPSPGLLHRRTD